MLNCARWDGVTVIRTWWGVLAFVAVLLLAGCWGESVEQMMRTAEFEELQRNHEHARQIYRRIIEKFPDSAEARKAAERFAALQEP